MTNNLQPTLPPGFLLGVATAAYQIEGGAAEGGRGPSIWDVFSHTPGKTLNGATGDVATDHYHRLDSDLDLISTLGVDAYRFSISWSRVIPDGEGHVNREGLDFYSRMVNGLIARGIEPVVTLYHWDLPQALHERYNGWQSRKTAYAFERFAEVVGAALGDRVAVWSTLNEPFCAAFLGYGLGTHAPGHASHAEALAAAHHLNLAHGLAIQALRRVVTRTDVKYSVVLNTLQLAPEGEGGHEAVRRIDAVANRIFTGPMLLGAYPDDLRVDTAHLTDWRFVLQGDEKIIHQPIDLLGVNYYEVAHVALREEAVSADRSVGGTAFPGADDVEFVSMPGLKRTTYGWGIEPNGLKDLLVSLHEQFPDQDIFVSENGGAFPDELAADGGVSMVEDFDRVEYLAGHVLAVQRALDQGVPVRGYFVWSLFDNLEWNHGYSQRFGIIRVDFSNLERIPKQSASWFTELTANRRIPLAIQPQGETD